MNKNEDTTLSTVPTINSKDVVCVRGRSYWEHPGNVSYRAIIESVKDSYSTASNRYAKSMIVTQIIDTVHDKGGKFVKKVGKGKNATWVICDENFAREKVSQSLRDILSFKYSSSTKRKRERKALKAKKEKVKEVKTENDNNNNNVDIDEIIQNNIAVSNKVESMRNKVEYANATYGNNLCDETMLTLMDQGNLDILETIKHQRTNSLFSQQSSSSSCTTQSSSTSDTSL
jgi:hypothetical protein